MVGIGVGSWLGFIPWWMPSLKFAKHFQEEHTWEDGGWLKNLCEVAGRISNDVHQ